MKRVLTAAEMREVDRAAAEQGAPPAVLMENAGEALAAEAIRQAGRTGRFLVLCGQGNNGGDGMVAARKLAAAGREVRVELVVPPEALKGEPARNARALRASGVSIAPVPATLRVLPGDVVVDALLGTGLNRAPDSAYADCIGRISAWQAAGARVVSADIPSGLHADTGRPFVPCVRADATVSFGFLKLGQVLEPGASICGELVVAEIGIPGAAASVLKEPRVYLLEESDAIARLPTRSADSHKGSYGHTLVVAGSWGKTGAAALAALGALRAGAGLVSVATRPEAMVPVMAHAPEMMGHALVSEGGLGLGDLSTLLELSKGKSSIVIGPGIPRSEETPKLLAELLEQLSTSVVLDADGLNALAAEPGLLDRARPPLLLTPHPGEMARLTGRTVAQVQEDRVGAARELATAHHAVVVLKGARTLIAREDGTVFVNPTGNAGMATGGTGDVLSGMCGALLGQGLSPEDAAVVAVYAHGLAGDLMARRKGLLGLVATDLLEGLGEVWVRWSR